MASQFADVAVRIFAGLLAAAAIAFALYIFFVAAAFGLHSLWKLIGVVTFALGALFARAAWKGRWSWGSD
jgi:hypothetical protein